MAYVRERLETATRALSDGDVAATVDALVELWSKVPSTRIAALVQKLSARLPYEELPKKVAEREARWLDLASRRLTQVVPALLSVEWPVHPRGVRARIEMLAEHPPDPRIAHAIRELWLAGRYRSNAGAVFWRKAFRLLLSWKDPQTTVVLESAKETDDGYFIVEPMLLRRTKTPLPVEPELEPEVTQALEQLEALGGVRAPSKEEKASREALFEAVYEEPSSDEPRLVLADFLQQEGDARGELIQLMHAIENGRGSRKMEERVKALLRASGKQWLDGLGSVVSDPVFRCGFASRVSLHGKIDPAVRAWATVEALALTSGLPNEPIAAALRQTNLRTLRRLDRAPMALVAELAESWDHELDRLGILAPLGPVRRSKLRVRHIEIASEYINPVTLRLAEVTAWLEGSAFAKTTKVLEISSVEPTGLELARAYLEKNRSLEALWLRVSTKQTWQLRLVRDESTNAIGLEIVWRNDRFERRYGEGLAPIVRQLDVSSSAVVARTSSKLAAAERESLVNVVREATLQEPRVVAQTFD